MPRAGNVYSLPPGTHGAPDTTIESAKYNAALDDLVEDANAARPRSAGGTGSDTAVGGSDNMAEGGASISSATVTNLASVNSVNATITGTTTIEEFGTVVNGAKRYLTFAGALTLTYHATKMILPGAENITTAAGDTCIAQSLGTGNWRVTHYTRAANRPGVLPATETIAGIVEKATVAETRSATADKFIAADLIETASALVTLTDATTVAVDWDTFINAEVEISANRALGNPTNGQPGTYRTILVKGSNSTDRTLTFGNQYLGELPPSMIDIDNGKWYLLTIRCITATHFVVSAQVALKP